MRRSDLLPVALVLGLGLGAWLLTASSLAIVPAIFVVVFFSASSREGGEPKRDSGQAPIVIEPGDRAVLVLLAPSDPELEREEQCQ